MSRLKRGRAACALSLAVALLAGCREAPSETPAPVVGTPTPPPSPEAIDPAHPWWRSVVFYEIFVRSFADSREGPRSGDGIGDLRGLIDRLDYLNDGDPVTEHDLEIGGIWLMPVMQSPSYHGYDVTDYRTIEKDYGTNDDFRALIHEANRRGIRVIVDMVLNHTSSAHPWFRDAWRQRSPFHSWYLWTYEPRDYLGPWGQPVWHPTLWWQRGWRHFNHMSYYGIFWSGMPDLNYEEPEVTAAMLDVCRFWIEEMGVDGFRLDAIRHLIENGPVQEDTEATHAWLRDFQGFLDSDYPEALTVGEVWAETETVATYGPDELDLTFQFALAREMLQAITSGSALGFVEEAAKVWAAFPGGQAATFLTNHDQVRTMSVLDGDAEGARLAATLLLTGPGVPFMYYGEEIGTRGTKPDPNLRKPMPWSTEPHAGFSTAEPWQELPIDGEVRNVELQAADAGSLLSHYRRLIRMRNRHPSLRVGSFGLIETGDDRLLAYERTTEKERTLVLVNLAETEISDYTLQLQPGWVAPGSAPVELLTGVHAHPFAADGYQPFPELEARTSYVLRWRVEDRQGST